MPLVSSLCAGLKFFRLNNVSIVIVFFLVFINMQISFSMLTSTLFSSVKTATGACAILAPTLASLALICSLELCAHPKP